MPGCILDSKHAAPKTFTNIQKNVYVNSLRFQWSAICHLLFGMAVSVIVYILAVFDVNAQLRCVWICVCASEYVEAHRSIMTHKIAVHAIVFR